MYVDFSTVSGSHISLQKSCPFCVIYNSFVTGNQFNLLFSLRSSVLQKLLGYCDHCIVASYILVVIVIIFIESFKVFCKWEALAKTYTHRPVVFIPWLLANTTLIYLLWNQNHTCSGVIIVFFIR